MATPIIDSGQCQVYTTNTYDTCGTLTRATINPATPDDVYGWYYNAGAGTWNSMTQWLISSFEMEMCGIRRLGFYDWIMSSMKDRSAAWNVRKVSRGPGIIEPFILGMQDSVLNDEDWTISAGWKTASGSPYNTGTLYSVGVTGPLTSLTGGDRVIRVSPTYDISVSVDYWLATYKSLIVNVTAGGTTQISTYRIIDAAAEAATPPTYVDVLIAGESIDTAAASFNSAPVSGITRIMPPNVMDVETFCPNRQNVNTKKMVPFWVETIRRARRICSESELVRQNLIQDNKWFATFQDISTVERNRQDEIKYRRELVNALLFQEAYSSNQTSLLWSALPQVNSLTVSALDTGTGGQLIGYRANLVGVLPQLRACGQVLDYQGANLDIKTWCETYIYPIFRARQSAGRPTTDIDIYTDSDTAAQVERAFVSWYKDQFGAEVHINIDAYRTTGANDTFGFTWRSFKVPTKPAGIRLNFIVSETFDDLINALSYSSQEQAGRYLWTADFGKSIYPAMVASNRKVHRVGALEDVAKIDQSFGCVMQNPTIDITLASETLTMVVECPLQSRVDHGFAAVTFTP